MVFLAMGLGVPLLLALAVQVWGVRHGWQVRRMLKYAFLSLWLWCSLVLILATRIDLFGSVVIGALVGFVTFVAYKIAAWGYKPVLQRYEDSLKSKH